MINKEEASIEELIAKGNELEQQGSFNEALEYWELAMRKSDVPNPQILAKFAAIAQRIGDFDRAEKAYRTLGLLYHGQDQYEIARDQIEKALQMRETPDGLVILGSTQLRLGLLQQARRSFEK